MPRVQVVYASRHGGTAGIARRIGEALRADGIDTEVVDAARRPDPSPFDAVVVGSGVYMGSWLKDGTEFLERNTETLATKPVWLFSSGPLKGSTARSAEDDPYGGALGPAEGPGSASRRKIEALAAAVHARDHRVLFGAFDPKDPPKAMSERLVRMTPAFKGVLPAGDFREWDVIDAWAREIAGALREPAAVG